MRTRWIRLTILTAITLLIATACGNETTPSQGTSPTGGAVKPLRVAVVAPSAPNDLAFTQSIVDALDRLKGQQNLEVAVSDSLFVVDDAAAAIRDYASKGYDLVIAHGSQYGASVQEIAPDFPKVSFAWGTAGDTFGQSNVFAYQAASDEGGYVEGVMAAGLSKSKIIGVVGPIEVGDASDVALASEAANSFVAAGADVMTGTAQMVVGAVGVAKGKNVAWFGTQSNQASLAPTVVVASQVYHWEVVLSQIIDSIRAGTVGGKSFTINLANDGEVIEFNDGYSLPADVKSKGEEAITGIKDGSIKTGASG